MAQENFLPQIGTPQPDAGNSPLPGTQDRRVFTEPPSGPMPSDELSKINYRGVEEAGAAIQQTTAKVLTNYMDEKSTEEAGSAVQRDPETGEVRFEPRTEIFQWDKVYNDVGQKLATTEMAGDIHDKYFELAQQNADDPQKFKIVADSYRKQLVASAPPAMRADLQLQALQLQNQFTEGIFADKAKADATDAKQGLTQQLDNQRNTIAALARQGGVETPDFKSAVGQANVIIDKLRTNPLFGYGEADAQKDRTGLQSLSQAESVIGAAVDVGRKQGEQSGLDALSKSIWDPKLNLSPAERESYESHGRVIIKEDDAASRQANADMERGLLYKLDDAGSMAETTGKWINGDVTPNNLIAAFGPDRGGQIIEGLNAKAASYAERKWVATATPAEIAARNSQIQKGLTAAPQSIAPKAGFQSFYDGFLASHEGGYAPNDGNGQPVNFGINQGANPGVDVKNLTQDQAAQILHDKYWVPSGADKLPAALAAVQGDTAVNMGVGAANRLLKQSGGDPQKYIDLRDAQYRQLAADDPAFASKLPGWLNRTQDLRAYVSGQGGASASNYRAQVIEYNAFQKAVQDRQKALSDDPSSYVAAVRPDLTATASAALQKGDAGAFQNTVRDSLQQQRDYGVLTPRVLSKSMSGQIVQQFNNPADPTHAADGMNTTIDGLASTYGQYFPQVMRELQKDGMPPEAVALWQVRGQGAVAVRMAHAINAMNQMGKNPNEGREKFFANAPNGKQITQALPDMMKDFAGSLTGSADAPMQLSAQKASLDIYARQLAYEGKQPADAVSQAYTDLVGNRYKFVDGYRVPQGLDSDTIRAGAEAVRSNLKASDLQPQGTAVPGVGLGDRQELSRKILSTRGVWISRSDDKGLALVWPGETGYVPATDPHGHPISYSWAALASAGKGAKPADIGVSGMAPQTGLAR